MERGEYPMKRTAAGLFLFMPWLSPILVSAADLPKDLTPGETLFNKNCSMCHGQAGSGTTAGPPLVHKIYEPGHHGDAAFQMAVKNGVRAHHWGFGNMPPLAQVKPEEVDQIVKYIRHLQRQAGIF
jgi:mono/diheme cytochrome c family protein